MPSDGPRGPHSPERTSVVVTGGSGFIGRAVVRAFRARGVAVTVVDRVPFPIGASGDDGDDGVHDGVHVVVGELRDAEVREAAVTARTAGIIHLAALTSVLRSVERPVETYADNVAVTQDLLELARRHEVPRFVLASTNAVIGDVGTATISVDLPPRPLTPYGATKAACEMLLSGYSGAYGMTTCALRFTNVYGPGMSHKDSFVPRLMRAALAGTGVRIHGDGEQRRDLVHLDDVVRAIGLAFDSGYSGRAIVGAGHSVSVLDLVETVRQVTGAALPVEHVAAPAGEMPAVVVDIAASAETIGYRPEVPLADGLASVWKYFSELARPAR
ncbi:NAD-dependent epimerase/dehydratase family protein [Amycolatopsis sp. H20-H5]|uniref:NAD-dependent epimerase/dehydratase family protein n=1 Tax=Amycolatopsis sp. H20-H5 TaxID=3046309 RepID=UPI002DBCAE4D|nr:NAD-dependent epimerase/dehydratase family protein [Amycolatopsis sp. H20-H5]MEC3976422.1 NAD-dependent epimerase/dehydratase family protein [Amycolatopsis sp. H20-H5]